ncbi:MAG: LamG domain-containing protein, partial [Armatimonadota bacterium]|nr:LamG domain-containing protein [Armatimonadota bacterium]
ESLAAEPGETAAAIATLQPGEGVASGEYPAHVTFSFRPGGGRPIELRATAVVALVGIAGQWHFDEGGVAADASPNHNDGTVQPGVAWAPGHRGQALRFDGAGCVEVPHSESLSIASSITVEAWVKPERFVGNDMIVVKTDYANEYLLYADARGTLHGRVRNGGSGRQDVVSAPGVLEPGVWQHIAFTWDTRAARLYCNGALLKEIETQRPAIGTNTAPMCIGGGAYAGGFHGLIDEVTIRTGALGPEDIRALYDQAR